ncbi:hypothetical protein LR48_Vigan07g250700 [Vigna angularis]|nr:hypothetical protein LR48_Vigan07g250700 [Vigna angularis]
MHLQFEEKLKNALDLKGQNPVMASHLKRQGFLYPAVALSIDPKIPDQASRKDTATPIDQDQKVSKKNRKSNHVDIYASCFPTSLFPTFNYFPIFNNNKP